MNRGLVLLLAGGLCACAGHGPAMGMSAGTFSPAPDVFACAQQQIKTIGFTQDSYNTTDLRLTARKYNEDVRRPNVQFRRLVDRLTITIGPGHSDTTTTLAVEARTFAELVTHRGPMEEQESTSETAQLAARAIIDRCAARP